MAISANQHLMEKCSKWANIFQAFSNNSNIWRHQSYVWLWSQRFV